MTGHPSVGTAVGWRPRGHLPWSPVGFWAAVGVVFLAAEIGVLGRWVAAGGPHPVAPRGDLPVAQAVAQWGLQIVIVAGLLASTGYAVRTSRRQGRVSGFAAVFVGGVTAFWLDPLYNVAQHVRGLSTWAPNVSTWGPYLPGWHGPAPDRQAETLVLSSGLVYGLVVYWILATAVVIGYAARVRPGWGPVRLAVAGALAGTVLDIVVEMAFLPSGAYAWEFSTPIGIFAGHWYQVPLFDNLIWGVVVCMPAAMAWHRAAHTGTDIGFLRGSDRTVPRLLAGVGFTHLVLAVNIAAIALTASMFTSPGPTDTPSYLRLDTTTHTLTRK